MPKLNPTMHEFANLSTLFRKNRITPPGWEQAETTKGRKDIKGRRLTGLEYSISKEKRNGKEKKVLTLTVPDLPFSVWCPEGGFYPSDEVEVIVWEVDGYKLRRERPVPAAPKTTTGQLTPVSASVMEDVPSLVLTPEPRFRHDSVLEPGNREGAWWTAAEVTAPEKEEKPEYDETVAETSCFGRTFKWIFLACWLAQQDYI